MSKSLPRGIRNFNPGNIRWTRPRTPWQGRVPEERTRDRDFEEFLEPRWGIRALARTLITYQDQHGCDTIRKIIHRWAPPVGQNQAGDTYRQNTGAYVNHVALMTNIGPDEPIDVQRYDIAYPLVVAIIRHENGNPEAWGRREWYPRDVIDAGLKLAGIEPPPMKRLARDPEVIGTASYGAGGAGYALLEAAPQLQYAAGETTSEVLKTLLIMLVVAGILLNVVGRLRRSKREGE